MNKLTASLGAYRPLKTPLHRLDARVKFVFLIVSIIAIFLPYGSPEKSVHPYATALVICGLLFLVALALLGIGRVSPLKLLTSLRGVWLIVLTMLVINIFFWQPPDQGWTDTKILFYVGDRGVYEAAFFFSGYVIARILLAVTTTVLFTATTKPLDIAYAIEWFGTPLTLIKVPVRVLGLMMSLALRFIPVLGQEAERIRKAQAARGLDYQNGNFKDKWKSLISLLIPLLVSAFIKAEELAQAMDARGYDPYGQRTRYRQSKFRLGDALWLTGILVFFALALFLVFYQLHGQRLDIFL